jgi:putative nucleotidyltransferase with HDIG domain
MARVEDANKHLAEINGMYISTIEALAMAVDAKDQVTHGHIRRVQNYAVGLAKALGIRDRGLLGAIEAASLLHDMGKLAIPEHILNKPGRLTEAEFSKMKLHASIGADILSSIRFPYPVIPIVRHHHENWDGTGYPDGLLGTAIPIGARILSVVDCFDALTSDRPYRPRLSDEQALAILLDRRGRMYDPLVVDTFIDVFRTIEIPDLSEVNDAHNAIALLSRALPEPLANPEGTRSLPSNAAGNAANIGMALRLFASTAGLPAHERLSVLAHQVRRIAAADTVVVQTTDATNTLRIVHADGLYQELLQHRSSIVGHGVTGWVAANGQFALNSPARLEFEAGMAAALQACTAVPLFRNGLVCGVLSVYSIETNHFTHENLVFLTGIAGLVSSTIEAHTPGEATAGALTERGVSELLQSNLRSDPKYSCQLLLVSGDHAKIERIQSALLDCDPHAIVARLTPDTLLCISTFTGKSLREQIPHGSDCTFVDALFPGDGRSACELLASLRQSSHGDLAQVLSSTAVRAQRHQ